MRYGDPDRGRLTLADRLSRRTQQETDCRLWTGARTGDGYGAIKVGGRMVRAHRVAYELAHGPIPAGLIVRHACDTPACVNPGHLLLGTQRDNVRDALARGRRPQNLAAA